MMTLPSTSEYYMVTWTFLSYDDLASKIFIKVNVSMPLKTNATSIYQFEFQIRFLKSKFFESDPDKKWVDSALVVKKKIKPPEPPPPPDKYGSLKGALEYAK